MRRISIILVLGVLFMLKASCQEECDSALFYKLYEISEYIKISESDFHRGQKIIESLNYTYCDHIILLPDSIYTNLTHTYGNLCLKTNTELSVKSFFDYRIKYLGSAEELLSFTFENIFLIRPETILKEISKLDTNSQKEVMNSLVWGFLNNRMYGEENPFEWNPFRAMTYYENLPEPLLNSRNYQEIYYKVNPKTKVLYNRYKTYYDYMLNGIHEGILFLEDVNKKE